MERMIFDGLAEESGIEKRYPKWRTGNTKSRVNKLNLNRFFNPSNAWAKNMREKNKLYEKLHD